LVRVAQLVVQRHKAVVAQVRHLQVTQQQAAVVAVQVTLMLIRQEVQD
jgi:hypothetical protein